MIESFHFPNKTIKIKPLKINMISKSKYKLPINIIKLFKLQHQISLKIESNHPKRNKSNLQEQL